MRREGISHPLQGGNAKGEQYTGNPYMRFDEGTEVERPPPTLLAGAWSSFIIPRLVLTAHQEAPNAIAPLPLRMHPRPLPAQLAAHNSQ